MVAPVASSAASTRGAESLRHEEHPGGDRLALAKRIVAPFVPAVATRKELLMQILPFEVEPNAGNHLAWINAILSLQRTLMAAERTAVTLIAFGFTVAQVFENLKPEVPPHLRELAPHLPRDVGLLMIAAGVGSLALFTWQYLRAVAYLGAGPFETIAVRPQGPMHQLACFTAYAIMLIGLVAFASIFVSL
jgi:putative membrane protein